MLFSPEELLKDSDCPSLQKLAGLVYDLQLEFEPAEGFQTAFRMLQCYTKLDPDVSDDEDNVVDEAPVLSRDAAQAFAKATGLLTQVWEQKVLDKDVV
ncbi:TPA: hypothetical protein ACH3X3_001884 [Trebouxia sp. C0006]